MYDSMWYSTIMEKDVNLFPPECYASEVNLIVVVLLLLALLVRPGRQQQIANC